MPSGDSLIYFDALAGRSPATSPARIDQRNGSAVLDFADSVDEQTDFFGVLPSHYGENGLSARIAWACSEATTGATRWRVEFERRPIDDPTEGSYDLDDDGFQPPVEATDAAPGVLGRLTSVTLSLSPADSGNAVAGELFRVRVTRVGSDVADTVSGDAELVSFDLSEA